MNQVSQLTDAEKVEKVKEFADRIAKRFRKAGGHRNGVRMPDVVDGILPSRMSGEYRNAILSELSKRANRSKKVRENQDDEIWKDLHEVKLQEDMARTAAEGHDEELPDP